MKKLLGAVGSVVALIVITAIGNGIGGLFGGSAGEAISPSSTTSVQEQLPEIVKEMKRQIVLPAHVDEETVLYDVEALGMQIIYRNRLVNITAADAREADIMSDLAPHVRANVCANTQMNFIFDIGVSTVYTYVDQAGEDIGSVLITPAQCEQLWTAPSQPQ